MAIYTLIVNNKYKLKKKYLSDLILEVNYF